VMSYDHWARSFNDERIGFVAMDIRGHGKSEGKRGHRSLAHITKDIDLFIEYAKKAYPNIPRILYGQSMGGNFSMNYVIAKKPSIVGLITTSPWLRLIHPPSDFIRIIGKFLTKMVPGISLYNGLNSRYLTHDEFVTKTLVKGPLVHDKISIKLFFDIAESGDYILQNRHRFNVPLLMMHGTRDRISSCRACAEFSQYTSKNTCFKPWDGGYHELHNEYDKQDVFGYIVNWIDQLPMSKR
jgi:alpha-beta hydrolase superfamily lysophospholipase